MRLSTFQPINIFDSVKSQVPRPSLYCPLNEQTSQDPILILPLLIATSDYEAPTWLFSLQSYFHLRLPFLKIHQEYPIAVWVL